MRWKGRRVSENVEDRRGGGGAKAGGISILGLIAAFVAWKFFGADPQQAYQATKQLTEQASSAKQRIGRGLLAFAPVLMKTLSVVGTVAMFLVGGGIINHAVPWMHHFSEGTVKYVQEIPSAGSIIGAVAQNSLNLLIGLIAGLLVLLAVGLVKKLWPKPA